MLLTAAFSYAVLFANVISGALLARGLGPSGRGLVAALVVISGVTHVVSTLGLPHALAHFIASGGDRNAACAYGLRLIRRQVCGNAVLNLAILFLLARHQGSFGWLLPFLLWAPGMTATVYGALVAQAESRLVWMNVLRSGPSLIALTVLVPLFLADALTVNSVGVIYSGSTAVTGCLAYRLLWRSAGGSPTQAERTAMWVYGRQNLLALLASAANGRVDQLTLAFLAASTTLGFYAVATSAACAAVPLCTSVGAVAFRRLAAASARGEGWPAAKGLLWATCGVSAAWAVVFVPLAAPLMRLVYGPGFAEAVNAARVLAVASVATALLYALIEVGRATGAMKHLGLAEVLGAAVTAVGMVVVISWRDSNLAELAVASGVGYVASALYLTREIRRALLSTARPST